MKPNDMDIDEILRRYLPRASQEEADEAGERVLKRIRAMRFSEAAKVRKPGWLPKFDLAVLAAGDELQGESTAVTITLQVGELLEERLARGRAGFVNLLL